MEITTHLPSKKVLFLAWHVAAEHLHRCNDDDNDNENWAAELRIETRWMMVWVLELIILTMKWVFFRCSLLAKVHKSVGFGSAERCIDNGAVLNYEL